MACNQPSTLRFTTDDTGYCDLIDTVYSQLCAVDCYLTRSVTRGMFYYYATSLLWKRKLCLDHMGEDPMDDFNTVDNFTLDYAIPKELHGYLGNLGDYVDASGIRWQPAFELFEPEQIQGLHGHFGPYPQNRFDYATRLSPLLTVYACLNESAGHQGMPIMPEGLNLNANENVLGFDLVLSKS